MWACLCRPIPLMAQDNLKDAGQFYPMIQNYSDDQPIRFSYLYEDWPDIVNWRSQGREKMEELLAYKPKQVPLNPEITESVKNRHLYTLQSALFSDFRQDNRSLSSHTGWTDKTGTGSHSPA